MNPSMMQGLYGQNAGAAQMPPWQTNPMPQHMQLPSPLMPQPGLGAPPTPPPMPGMQSMTTGTGPTMPFSSVPTGYTPSTAMQGATPATPLPQSMAPAQTPMPQNMLPQNTTR